MESYNEGPITQEGRLLKLTTPLDQDYLLIQDIVLVEEISKLPHARCTVLHQEKGSGKEPTPLDVDALLGQAVTVTFSTVDETSRYYNGIVNRCSQSHRDERYTYYTLEIVPTAWLLTQNQNSRIFQHITIPKVLEDVLAQHQIELHLGNVDWKPRNYIVQYRESDFDFISRLMEDEGIFYYFTHEEDSHKMILCLDQQSHVEMPMTPAEIPFITEIEEREFVPHLWALSINYQLLPGKYTLWDHAFEKPTDNFEVMQPTRFKFGPNEEIEQYHYPAYSTIKHDVIDANQGEQGSELQYMSDDIKRSVENRQLAIDVRHRVITASGNCCAFTAGHKFKLKNHPSKETNGSYVITRVEHTAVQEPLYDSEKPLGGYSNTCELITWGEKAVTFRPQRTTPKPMILTAQTATVVGKSGEEIYTDKYGRVKVQFHWDREGPGNEGSSAWARVAQQWAGNRWGAMFIPRIGMEVLVHFLEGDPDQPIITGCVYNQESMPPYELPNEKTKSGVKSDSSLGGKGFNEWRFEDKKGEEQIFMHGEFDMDVRIKNDRREWTGNDQHLLIVNDFREQVKNNTHLTVDNDQYEHIKNDRHLKVGTSISNKEAKEVTGTQTLKVGGDQGIQVTGSQSQEVTGSMYLKGMNVVVEGMTGVTLKCGGNFVSVTPGGVFIQGNPVVLINSGGAAGAGTPVGPCPPTAPEQPDEADNAKPGEKAKLLARSQKRKDNKPSKEDPKKKSWIKIKLVDEEGKPVPGEAYEIKTSDGKKRSGSLNNKGEAHVKGIEPGNCEVTFPNLDKDAWKDA